MTVNFSLLPDTVLVHQFLSGSEEAFETIYDRYWGLLYLHAYRMLKDKEDAKDLVQELFTALWKKKEQLQPASSLSAYLYTAVRNRVLNAIAHNKVHQNHLQSLQRYIGTSYTKIDDPLHQKQLAELIENESRNLPPKMRQVFELSRKANLSHREIADRLHISDKTVKKAGE